MIEIEFPLYRSLSRPPFLDEFLVIIVEICTVMKIKKKNFCQLQMLRYQALEELEKTLKNCPQPKILQRKQPTMKLKLN